MGKPIPNENILELIKKVKPLLDQCDIPYWLGRGVARDLMVNKELKGDHSDLDFHVLAKDKEILKQKMMPIFSGEGYLSEPKEEDYKLAFKKPANHPTYYIEFPYIFNDEENPAMAYHLSCGKKRYCPKKCFNLSKIETIKINGTEVRIPALPEKYFSGIYSDQNWKNECIKY